MAALKHTLKLKLRGAFARLFAYTPLGALANRLARGPYNMPPEKPGSEEFYHYSRLSAFASLVYPLMWFLDKIERLLRGFVPGHNLIAKTKRRVWRARRTPIFIDGRSIAEAALNTKIGTAAPF